MRLHGAVITLTDRDAQEVNAKDSPVDHVTILLFPRPDFEGQKL